MWIDRIRSLTDDATFSAPATPEQLMSCERALGHPLPSELQAILRESNGVEGEYGLGLIWSAERIAEDNMMFRTDPSFIDLYMPFDPLLFFADAGNGDQFASIVSGQRQDIFVWDHETDSRTWVAPRLEEYLEWWLDGRITL